MANEYTQPYYRAVLLPHHAVLPTTSDAGNSSYTQAGPVPGVPIAQQDTEGVLESSGTQSAAGALRVKCVKAGFPGREGAGFVWKQSADSTFRGWDAPQWFTSWEVPNFATGSAALRNPRPIALAGGKIVVAHTTISAGNMVVRVDIRATAGTWTTDIDVDSEVALSARHRHPELVLLPSGRILCFYWTLNGTENTAQIRMSFSDDDAVTWAVGSRFCLPAALLDLSGADTVREIAAAHDNGQIVLFATTVDDSLSAGVDNIIAQYASDDLGVSFSSVYTQDGVALADTGAAFSCVALNGGGFLLGYIPGDTVYPTVVKIGSAYHSFGDVTGVTVNASAGATISGQKYTDRGLALAKEPNGTIWAFMRTAADRVIRSVSYDNGASWVAGLSGARVFEGDSTTYLDQFAACWQRGRVALYHNHVSASDTSGEAGAMGAMYIGGYSDQPLPFTGTSGQTDTAVPTKHWIAIEEPQNHYYTPAGTASVEVIKTPGVLDLHTTGGNSRTYTEAITTTLAQGAVCIAQWSTQAGTSALQVSISDGVDDYGVLIEMTTTALDASEENGGAAIGSTASITGTNQHQVMVFIQGGTGSGANDNSVAVYWRVANTGEDREWTLLGQTNANNAATDTSERVKFGHLGTGASESEWTFVQYKAGSTVGLDAVAQATRTKPDDFPPRPFSVEPIYIDDGVKLSMVSGPAFFEDDWHIDTRYNFPIERIDVTDTPSPNTQWRATGTSDETIAYVIDSIDDADWPTDLLGIYLDDTNFSEIVVKTEATPGAGFSTTLFTASMKTAVAYGRNGKSVELIATGANTQLYMEADQYKGCDFMFSSSKIREITTHTSGLALTSGPTKVPRLFMDSIDGTEPSGVTTGQIINKRALLIIQLAGVKFSGIQIILKTAGSTPSPTKGYFHAGTILIGSIFVLGMDPAAQRSVGNLPNVAVTTGPDGRRQTRKKGPARKTIRVDWPMVDSTKIFDQSADYILASDVSNAESVGVRFDAAQGLSGLQRHTDGPSLPFVWIPRMAHLTSATSILLENFAEGAVLVRMMGELEFTTTNTRGTEGLTEIVRVGMTLDAEV